MKKTRRLQALGVIAAASFLSFSSCSSSNFKGSRGGAVKPKEENKIPEVDKPTDPVPVDNKPTPEIQKHKAVFAVKNISCALCHAKVESGIISDFAVGSGGISEAQSLQNLLYLVNHKDVSPLPSVSGSFIVPKTTISSPASGLTATGESNCADKSNFGLNEKLEKVNLKATLDKCASSKFQWGSSSEKFVEKTKVEITPPSKVEEFQALYDGVFPEKSFATIGEGSSIQTPQAVTGGFKLTGNITCEGAVLFDTALLLQNVTFQTNEGCRIYATGSIFGFGNISVSGGSEKSNLQLASLRVVGFEINTTTITDRMKHATLIRQNFSGGTQAATDLAKLIDADAAALQIKGLAGGGNISYAKIAAMAPVVQFRTTGGFSGLIIAEQFLGKIGALSFKFDPVFEVKDGGVSLFPEIKKDFVVIED